MCFGLRPDSIPEEFVLQRTFSPNEINLAWLINIYILRGGREEIKGKGTGDGGRGDSIADFSA